MNYHADTITLSSMQLLQNSGRKPHQGVRVLGGAMEGYKKISSLYNFEKSPVGSA
jgi:hypothetical protein